MRAEVHIIATIFLVQDFAISGHEHGYGIGKQEHAGGQSPRQTVGTGVANSGILEVYGIHQMVQRHVSVATTQTRKEWSEKACEGDQRIAAEGAEKQVEPDDVRFLFADRIKNAGGAGRIVERPAPLHRETFQLGFGRGDGIGENRQANKGISLQLVRDVQPVLAESTLAGWKSCNQTNFHSLSGPKSIRNDASSFENPRGTIHPWTIRPWTIKVR